MQTSTHDLNTQTLHARKVELLTSIAQNLDRASRTGNLSKQPFALGRITTIAGPRIGALRIDAGINITKMRKVDDHLLSQFFWDFPGELITYMQGKMFNIECPWPGHMADTSIHLRDLWHNPPGPGRFIVGKNTQLHTVVYTIGDNAPHLLIAGMTGSGKTVATRLALFQLAVRGHCQMILIDGKRGNSLRHLERLPGVLGPIATTHDETRAALQHAINIMNDRYDLPDERKPGLPLLIVCVEEVHLLSKDKVIASQIATLTSSGRAARVSLIITTQHPTVDALGDNKSKANLPGRLVLRVESQKNSEVALSSTNFSAHKLLGQGDLITLITGSNAQRVQGAFADDAYMSPHFIDPTFKPYAPYEANGNGQPITVTHTTRKPINLDELALGLIHAHETMGQGGRPTLQRMIQTHLDVSPPGATRADRILKRTRALHLALAQFGYQVQQVPALSARTDDNTPNE